MSRRYSIDGNLAALAQYEREMDAAQRRDEWLESIIEDLRLQNPDEDEDDLEYQAREIMRMEENAGPDSPL